MPTLKIHLSHEEYDPICRTARRLGLSPEELGFAGLHSVMSVIKDRAVQKDILELRNARRESLPRWADEARSVHAYEGLPDELGGDGGEE